MKFDALHCGIVGHSGVHVTDALLHCCWTFLALVYKCHIQINCSEWGVISDTRFFLEKVICNVSMETEGIRNTSCYDNMADSRNSDTGS